MGESNTFVEFLKKNSTIFLAILMMPVVGMAASIPLVIWKAPDNMVIVLGVIMVLMIQYILLVRWISKKMDKLLQHQIQPSQ